MQGRRLNRRVRVTRSQADASMLIRTGPVRTFAVIIRNLPADSTPLSVSQIVSEFGSPLLCQQSGDGSWRVTFGTRAEARLATAGLEGLAIGDVTLSAMDEEDMREGRANTAVVAKGVPTDLSNDDAMRVFQRFGHVIDWRTSRKPNKPTFRISLEYTTYDAARNAVTVMNGQVLSKETGPITVKFSSGSRTSVLATKKLRRQKSVADAVLLMGRHVI